MGLPGVAGASGLLLPLLWTAAVCRCLCTAVAALQGLGGFHVCIRHVQMHASSSCHHARTQLQAVLASAQPGTLKC